MRHMSSVDVTIFFFFVLVENVLSLLFKKYGRSIIFFFNIIALSTADALWLLLTFAVELSFLKRNLK
uniref:Uncharacterized protein n=1 Tax=Lepeophtheirus salmonis TaxID=72036 RepID=A0A0K2V5Z6_LEPSM